MEQFDRQGHVDPIGQENLVERNGDEHGFAVFGYHRKVAGFGGPDQIAGSFPQVADGSRSRMEKVSMAVSEIVPP